MAPAVRAARDSVESNLVQAQGQRDLTLAMCVPERLPCYQNNKLSHESVYYDTRNDRPRKKKKMDEKIFLMRIE